jgi:hypothetical protein
MCGLSKNALRVVVCWRCCRLTIVWLVVLIDPAQCGLHNHAVTLVAACMQHNGSACAHQVLTECACRGFGAVLLCYYNRCCLSQLWLFFQSVADVSRQTSFSCRALGSSLDCTVWLLLNLACSKLNRTTRNPVPCGAHTASRDEDGNSSFFAHKIHEIHKESVN